MIINIPFRPRAQVLLQLGEQLIKSESVAILELIKNAYDADAKIVTITMDDVDEPDKGYIEIIDDGIGMNLWTVQNIWMEPGNTHKKDDVEKQKRTKLGRLPIGEKGIGRFGAHKLGKRIEMITRSDKEPEVVVSINWRDFDNAEYLENVNVTIEQRMPTYFTGEKTGTRLYISDLSTSWTRGMMRKVYRSITSLNSPFSSNNKFRTKFQTNKKDWLEGLMTFSKIKKNALYSGEIEVEGSNITSMTYRFTPLPAMTGLKPRQYELQAPVQMVQKVIDKEKKSKKSTEIIDLGKHKIGKIKISLLVFDRDSLFRAKYIEDQTTYGDYLDENGGVQVFRDGVRIYDYGEQGNDWLGLDSSRINTPGRYLSNNLVLGAVHLDRFSSLDLKEKANREGFIENDAYAVFRAAVFFAINYFTAQRNIDKETLRVYLNGGPKEPVKHDVSIIRQKIATCIADPKERNEIDGYLKRIESDFEYIKKMYLKTASAGMSYGVVIHEIEKVINELNIAVKKENASQQITTLARHLARLVDSYAELLRNRSKSNNRLRDMINQAIFSLQYRLEAHEISVEGIDEMGELGNESVECVPNLIVGSIINIIDNSIWWTTFAKVPKRCIYLKATREIDNHLSIVIADNGCGFSISPADAIKPFVSTKPSGMGLGLNIVNEIMISQGGSLNFLPYGDVELPEKYRNGAIVALTFKEA